MTDKPQAQNIDAEESLLSALMIDNETIYSIDALDSRDFYKPANGYIFEAIQTLIARQTPADLVTVATHLDDDNLLQAVGGSSYLARIADAAPMALNTKHYAQIIKDCAVKRDITLMLMKALDMAQSSASVNDILHHVQSEPLKIQTSKAEDSIKNIYDLAVSSADRIEKRMVEDNDQGYEMGFPRIDRLITIQGSKLILIAGRPAMGKTALMLTIVRNMALDGVTCGVLSIEMDNDQIMDRFIGMESGINTMRFHVKDGLSTQGLQTVNDSIAAISEWPVMIDDSECTIQDVERKCRKMKQLGCQVLFIDQLSKIRGRSGASKFDTYSDHCSAIALLKKELRIPIFLLCQINRSAEDTRAKEPALRNLKQTGMLEEDADLVLMIHRPGYYDQEIDPSVTVLNLGKHRQGATYRDDKIFFDPKRTRFEQAGV